MGEVSENNPLIASIATVDQAGIRAGMLPSPFCRTSFDNPFHFETYGNFSAILGRLLMRDWGSYQPGVHPHQQRARWKSMMRYASSRSPHNAGRRRRTVVRAVMLVVLLAAMLGLAAMLLCSLYVHWPRAIGLGGGQRRSAATSGLGGGRPAEEEGARLASHGPLKESGRAEAGGPPGSGGAAGETAGNNRQAAAAVDMDSAWGVLLAAVKARQQQRQGGGWPRWLEGWRGPVRCTVTHQGLGMGTGREAGGQAAHTAT